jgi:hypothetical protein
MFEDGGEAEPRAMGAVRVIFLFYSAFFAVLMLLGILGYLQ